MKETCIIWISKNVYVYVS